MRIPLLVIAITLMAACSEDAPPPQAAATPSQAPAPPTAQQAAAIEKADVAAAEIDDQATDPCDLRAYDMSKMTVELHEKLVESCQRSKE